jgi:hypothetical protein
MRQSLGDCTGQDVLSCIFLFFIKLYLGLMLGRLERLFALAEAGKLGPESPLAARAPRPEGGVAAAGQAAAQRNQDLISGLWASFVGWASSNPSYGSASGGSAEADPAPVAAHPQADSPAPAARAALAAPAALAVQPALAVQAAPTAHAAVGPGNSSPSLASRRNAGTARHRPFGRFRLATASRGPRGTLTRKSPRTIAV